MNKPLSMVRTLPVREPPARFEYKVLSEPTVLATAEAFRAAVYRAEGKPPQPDPAPRGVGASATHEVQRREVFGAFLGDQMVATMSFVGLGGISPGDRLSERFSVDDFAGVVDPSQMAFVSGFAMHREHRQTECALGLMRRVTKHCVDRGIRIVFIACQPHLVRYYLRLGFRTYREAVNDEHVGVLVPMLAVCGDRQHQEAIRSPIRDVLLYAAPEDTGALERALGETAGFSLRCQPVEECWPTVRDSLRLLSGAVTDNLREADLSGLISSGIAIRCRAGCRVLCCGQRARTLYLLAEGALEVRDGGSLVHTVRPGEVVGEASFLLPVASQAFDVWARQDALLIAISPQVFHSRAAGTSAWPRQFLKNLSTLVTQRDLLV